MINGVSNAQEINRY